MHNSRIHVATILGAHGVRGAVRLRAHTAIPQDVLRYGVLEDATGTRTFAFFTHASHKTPSPAYTPPKEKSAETRNTHERHVLIVRDPTLTTRDAAEVCKGMRLYVARSRLPDLATGEYYACDLIGLRVLTHGEEHGVITATHDFGAGMILEITPLYPAEAPSYMLPFRAPYVGTINLDARTVDVVIPDGWLEGSVQK